MKVGVVGLGYIGLPTAFLLASVGHKVVGVDIDRRKVNLLKSGKIPMKEKGISELFHKAKKRIAFTDDYSSLDDANAIIVCVPTPAKKGKMDTRYIKSAAKELGRFVRKGQLIVLESTVAPGTTRNLFGKIIEEVSGLRIGEDLLLCFCPERAIPGNTIFEMVHNDRVVGGVNKKSLLRAKRLYKTFVKGKIFLTNLETAEFVKLIENTYRDVNIAFANELAKIAERIGINVFEAIKLANRHPRVNIHIPGIGVGGHCIPVDPWFLVEVAPNETKLIKLARRINDEMVKRVAEVIFNHKIKKVTIFGEAYKPNVDDTRESPTYRLAELLKKRGIEVGIYDPVVHPEQKLDDFIHGGVQAIVISTAHDVFRKISWKEVISAMKPPKLIIDGRGFFNKVPEGCMFYGIGRGDVV